MWFSFYVNGNASADLPLKANCGSWKRKSILHVKRPKDRVQNRTLRAVSNEARNQPSHYMTFIQVVFYISLFFSIGVDSTRGIICRIFPVAFCRACENDATFVRSQLRFRETNFPRNIWQTFHTLVKRNVTFSIFHSHCGAIDSDYLSQCFCYFLSSLEQRHTHVYPIWLWAFLRANKFSTESQGSV